MFVLITPTFDYCRTKLEDSIYIFIVILFYYFLCKKITLLTVYLCFVTTRITIRPNKPVKVNRHTSFFFFVNNWVAYNKTVPYSIYFLTLNVVDAH